ncbi:MAG: hypothetical protein IKZ88_03515 [Neisseriaceae bacterium]|nr:hypothetical protein [Neisseriaceae bacterium]
MWVFLPTRFNPIFRLPESISLWLVENPPYNISVIASRDEITAWQSPNYEEFSVVLVGISSSPNNLFFH